MKKELVMLVGNIGSGKTTTCKKYQQKGHIVIARDRLRYNIGGGQYIFNKKFEPIIFSTELHMLENFMEIGVPIIIDEVGISKLIRMRYILLAQNYGYKIKCHVMSQLTMKEAVDRRMQDPHGQYNRKIWEKVWLNFQSKYEEPSLEEGIDKIIKDK